jgi:hypothetical protein
MRRRRCRERLAISASLFWAGSVAAADFCVGTQNATHATLPAAVAAAAANGPGLDRIHLNTGNHAVPDTLVINDQSLEILGGYANCQIQMTPSGHSIIDGAGGIAGSVIEINAAGPALRQVDFNRIQIVGGGNDGSGGGLHANGAGLLVRLVYDVTINGNVSNYGGGIFVQSARLELDDANVLNNDAMTAGGGVDCLGGDVVVRYRNIVQNNRAPNGGGISLRNGCDIGFYGGNPFSLYNNTAYASGGGLFADGTSTVQVLRAPPGASGSIGRYAAFQVNGNHAAIRGGGIALDAGAQLLAQGLVMQDNEVLVPAPTAIAPRGAAIHAGTNSVVELRVDPRCAPGQACNLLLGNRIVVNHNAPASGGAALAAIGSRRVLIEGTEIAGNGLTGANGGASAVLLADIIETSELSRVLMHRNGATLPGANVRHTLELTGMPQARLRYLTLVDNDLSPVAGSAVARFANVGQMQWLSSIVDQPGHLTASLSSVTQSQVDCLMATELGGLPGHTRSLSGSTTFRDRGAGDFRPAIGAPQIDYCDGPAATPGQAPLLDLAMQPAPEDTGVRNLYGLYDLGAFEAASAWHDAMFGNGFESQDKKIRTTH